MNVWLFAETGFGRPKVTETAGSQRIVEAVAS
jgi:hypothetical protein